MEEKIFSMDRYSKMKCYLKEKTFKVKRRHGNFHFIFLTLGSFAIWNMCYYFIWTLLENFNIEVNSNTFKIVSILAIIMTFFIQYLILIFLSENFMFEKKIVVSGNRFVFYKDKYKTFNLEIDKNKIKIINQKYSWFGNILEEKTLNFIYNDIIYFEEIDWLNLTKKKELEKLLEREENASILNSNINEEGNFENIKELNYNFRQIIETESDYKEIYRNIVGNFFKVATGLILIVGSLTGYFLYNIYKSGFPIEGIWIIAIICTFIFVSPLFYVSNIYDDLIEFMPKKIRINNAIEIDEEKYLANDIKKIKIINSHFKIYREIRITKKDRTQIRYILGFGNNKYKENQINYEINSQFLEIVEAIKEWCKINKIENKIFNKKSRG